MTKHLKKASDYPSPKSMSESGYGIRTELAHEWWVGVCVYCMDREEAIFGGQPGVEKDGNKATSLWEKR